MTKTLWKSVLESLSPEEQAKFKEAMRKWDEWIKDCYVSAVKQMIETYTAQDQAMKRAQNRKINAAIPNMTIGEVTRSLHDLGVRFGICASQHMTITSDHMGSCQETDETPDQYLRRVLWTNTVEDVE